MSTQDPKLKEIWHQTSIPVVVRKTKGNPLLIRLAFAPDNREWLKSDHRINPIWNTQYKHWETPRSWFEPVVQAILERFGAIYVIQPLQPLQVCARACWDAAGLECECSCMGAHHGSGHPQGRWYEVSETCALTWGERKYSYRLLKPKM
jgi:hypothetical protein